MFKPDVSFQTRERDLLARITEVYNREQGLAAKEAEIEQRKRDVHDREQYVAAQERARTYARCASTRDDSFGAGCTPGRRNG